jgi:1-pyrroline-5-carboxylate dehydrogenase
MGAVIDEKAFRRHSAVFDEVRSAAGTKILTGGRVRGETGWFVEPTLIETSDPASRLMTEEFFGPIVAVLVYPDERYSDIVRTIDETGRYGLTGSVFARDRTAISAALEGLRNAAGNFYINDKPTGAVVGQQPFGGARASGTNDKAGSMWNLARWVSPRSIKETFHPPSQYPYAFMS